MPTPLHLKPPTAAWIVRERKRLGLKPADIVAQLKAQGLEVSEDTVKVWESNADRRPAPENLAGLERIFDSTAPQRGAGSSAGQSDLITALARQTAALEAHTLALTRQADLVEVLLERLGAATARESSVSEAVADLSDFLHEQWASVGRGRPAPTADPPDLAVRS